MAAAPRRRRVPLALGAALLLTVCAGLLVAVLAEPARDRDPDAPPRAATVETAPLQRAPAARTDVPAGARRPPASEPFFGPDGVARRPSGEVPDDALRVATDAAQEHVFDGLRERDTFLGVRSRRAGTFGVGGGAGGGFAGGPSPPAEGRVVDDRTGTPLAGAEVIVLVEEDDGWARRAWSRLTDADGAFSVRMSPRHRDRAALLVRAPGYAQQRRRREAAPAEWRLDPVDGPDRGTIRGRAETPDGAPLAGMLLVAMEGEHGDAGDQYAWCDGSGTFELVGVPPGRWRLSLERDRVVETTVVAGGLATARLTGARPDAPPPAVPGTDRRIVEVSGVPEGATLRADGGPGVFWRAVVRDGVARYELPFGLWVLIVDRTGGDVMPVVVKDAPGVQRVAFEPAGE